MSAQAAFAACLLDPRAPAPPGLKTWNRSDPAPRLAVYRNNVVVSLVDALAETFPVTLALVGDAFFRAMAREFVRARPPRDRVLTWVGAGFAAFIADFEPARGLAYLPEVAEIEMLRVRAYHAADAVALAPERLAVALAEPMALAHMRLQLHPSVQVLTSRHAGPAVWAAHQLAPEERDAELARIDASQAQGCMVFRVDTDVLVRRVSVADACFLLALRALQSLGVAALEAEGQDADFDLAAALAPLLRHQLIIDLTGGQTHASSA